MTFPSFYAAMVSYTIPAVNCVEDLRISLDTTLDDSVHCRDTSNTHKLLPKAATVRPPLECAMRVNSPNLTNEFDQMQRANREPLTPCKMASS